MFCWKAIKYSFQDKTKKKFLFNAIIIGYAKYLDVYKINYIKEKIYYLRKECIWTFVGLWMLYV